MKSTVRILSLILSVITAVSLASCAEKEQNPDNTSEATAAVTTLPEETVNPLELEDPKLAALDWGGNDFTVGYNGNDLEPNLDFVSEGLNGALLNDAVYKRNLAIEEKHKLTIVPIYEKDEDIQNRLTNQASSGESDYMLVEVNQNYSMSLAIKGLLTEISKLEAVNTEKPYWNSKMLAGSTIGGKAYFAYSDANVHAIGATPCTMFNKLVHKEFSFEDIYKLVSDGKWTFETMSTMVKAVTADTDGDGKITQDDRVGMTCNNFCVDCFISGTGYKMVTKDDGDMPVLSFKTEEFYDIVEEINTLLAEENGMFLADRISTSTEAREYWPINAFTDNRALFLIGNFKDVERLRNMEGDFGVVPMPKRNESQKDYAIHMQANIGAAMSVPANADNLNDISVILEDIAYLSYVGVMPQYMEVLIQGQLVRDVESLQSIEIIRNSYYCDLGFMLSNYDVKVLSTCRNIITKGLPVTSSLDVEFKTSSKKVERIKDLLAG